MLANLLITEASSSSTTITGVPKPQQMRWRIPDGVAIIYRYWQVWVSMVWFSLFFHLAECSSTKTPEHALV